MYSPQSVYSFSTDDTYNPALTNTTVPPTNLPALAKRLAGNSSFTYQFLHAP